MTQPSPPRQDFEGYLGAVSAAFSRLPLGGADGTVERALAGLVEILGVDRASFFQVDAPSGAVRLTHTWARIGLPLAPTGDLRSRLPWYANEIRAGRDVVLYTADLPREARAEREFCRASGFEAVATLPLRISGRVSAGISVGAFDRPDTWPPVAVEKLRLVGEIFGSALARDQALARLDLLEDRLARLEGRTVEGPGEPEGLTLRDAMRRHVTRVLGECGWRVKGPGGAAECLDVPPSTLRFQMKRLGITRPAERQPGGRPRGSVSSKP